MRHRVYGKHLGRDKDGRQNLFKGLVQALFTHGTIQTSEAKAKAIKGLIDKVVNLAKDERTRSRVQSFLNDKGLTNRLIKEILPKLGSRNSGYTSLVKMGTRAGDQTMMVKMSLIGAEELKPIEKGIGSRVQAKGTLSSIVKTEEKKKTVSAKKGTPVKKVTPKKKVEVKKPTKRATRKK